MNIMPVGAPLAGMSNVQQMNSTIDSANTAAQSARFSEMLRDLQEKTSATSGHVVNEAAKSKQDKELKKACKGFEAMFLSMMYKQMRATVPKNTLFGESNATKIFRDVYDQKLMEKVADGGGLGLGDMLYKQLSPQVLGKQTKA